MPLLHPRRSLFHLPPVPAPSRAPYALLWHAWATCADAPFSTCGISPPSQLPWLSSIVLFWRTGCSISRYVSQKNLFLIFLATPSLQGTPLLFVQLPLSLANSLRSCIETKNILGAFCCTHNIHDGRYNQLYWQLFRSLRPSTRIPTRALEMTCFGLLSRIEFFFGL